MLTADANQELFKGMSETHARILIVDDDQAHASVTAEVLDRARQDWECNLVHDGESAQRVLLRESFDLVLLDLKLPDIDGMQLLEVIKERAPECEVIIMTGYGSVSNAVEALQKGAFSFIEKPLQKDHLRNQVAKALERRRLSSRNRELEALVDERFGFEGIIGNSQPMQRVFERIRQVAPTEARVLITGPNGSGKELVARAIHFNSKRRDNRLVALNCGAITGDLLQSELFGHVRGSFTGADRDREGKFEFAHGGTLFLDEIGEMPLEAQVRLLRVLETGEVIRVGSNTPISVNVRLLSATNKDLKEEVAAGRFREDLYFRLRVVEVQMPPLRERGGDIVLLAESFLREFARKYERNLKTMDPEVVQALSNYEWPGNVRELRNSMEEMVILTSGDTLNVASLPPHLAGSQSAPGSRRVGSGGDPFQALVGVPLNEIERNLVRVTLEAMEGNRERTAKALGIGERTLYRKLKEFGLG